MECIKGLDPTAANTWTLEDKDARLDESDGDFVDIMVRSNGHNFTRLI